MSAESMEYVALPQLLALSDEELASFDPLVMNLLVAKAIPSNSDLKIQPYIEKRDSWATEIDRRCNAGQARFNAEPHLWKGDFRFFRLVVLASYLDIDLSIRYREDQRNLSDVVYTDPAQLFLYGVMDSRQGTCANMAALQVAIGWKLGWPMSLACIGSHLICRFDDGAVTHNIEATNTGKGIQSHPDEYYLEAGELSQIAVECQSDLRAITPRELLGLFIGLRARYFADQHQFESADEDYLVARWLFPRNRHLWKQQVAWSIRRGLRLFTTDESGHPVNYVREVYESVRQNLCRNYKASTWPHPANEIQVGW